MRRPNRPPQPKRDVLVDDFSMDFVRLGARLVSEILHAYATEKQPASEGQWAGCRLSRRQLADRFQVSKRNVHEILGHPDPIGAARRAYAERKEEQRAEQEAAQIERVVEGRAQRAEQIATTPLPEPFVEPRVVREIAACYRRGVMIGDRPATVDEELAELSRIFALDRRTILGALREAGYSIAIALAPEQDQESRRWKIDPTKWSTP